MQQLKLAAKIGPIILVIALSFIIYGNSLQGKFLWDDEYIIKHNTYLRNFSSLPKVFSQDIGHGSGRKFGFYRPVQIVSYMSDYMLYGLGEWGYHLTNIMLHILTVLCIFTLFNLLFNRPRLALIASLLFLVHPINTAIVSYISGRADSLAAMFMLVSFIFYVKNTETRKLSSEVIFTVSYILALLSKEISFIFPALIILYHYTFGKKIYARYYLLILLPAIFYLLLRMTLLKHIYLTGPLTIAGTTTILQRLPSFFDALTEYAKILALPSDLRMGRGMMLFSFAEPIVIGGIFLFALLIASAVFFKKQKEGADSRICFFGIVWFLTAIIPVSNIFALNAYMAEHWLSFPSIGLFLALACILDRMHEKKILKALNIFLTVGLIVYYGYSTMMQNVYWRNSLIFHERTLRYSPYDIKSMTDLARQYEFIGKRDEAINLYKRVIMLNPNFPISYNNLGLLYHNMGRDDEAIELYKKAIEIDPKYHDALNNLATLYQRMGKYDEAVELYKKAIDANPNFESAYCNLGVAYASAGKTIEALEAYKKAIEINPGFENSYYNMALIYTGEGKLEDALRLYNKVLEINPDHPQANNNIAIIYYKTGRYDLAIRYADKALALGYRPEPQFLSELGKYRNK